MESMKQYKSVFNNGTATDIFSFEIKKINSEHYENLSWKDKQAVIHWMQECIDKIKMFQKEIVDNNMPF